MSELGRVGILISKRGTWRNTVAHYATIKDCSPQALDFYDQLIEAGWIEYWAALRAVDQFACADVIFDANAITQDEYKKSSLN